MGGLMADTIRLPFLQFQDTVHQLGSLNLDI